MCMFFSVDGCGSLMCRGITRPASRCGTETWPDLRIKWPQVDHRRLDHIRLDLTWQRLVTWVDFRSCDELAWTLCIASFMYSIMTFLSCAGFAAAALFTWLSVAYLFCLWVKDSGISTPLTPPTPPLVGPHPPTSGRPERSGIATEL